MSSITASSVKPFLAGAITALSAAWILQRLAAHRTKLSLSSCRRPSVSAQQTPPDVLLDSPLLEERMIRKAEAAIRGRTSRLVIVVERCTNNHNYSAILRTAEALGIQHVYIISPPPVPQEDTLISSTGRVLKQVSSSEMEERAMHHLFAQRATEWLTVHEFDNTTSCLTFLRSQHYQIWATDLGQSAVCLTESDLQQHSITIPPKLAIVFGTEAVGCTQECLEAADLRVYLPLRGFADSLNLSVATALVIHQLFVLDPTLIGSMEEQERRELRQEWFTKLAMQRLLTSTQKRHKNRLETKLKNCQRLQQCLEQGGTLQPEQEKKLYQIAAIQHELETIHTELQKKARMAVADLVDHPPEPITDMRRADEHRTCFVGPKTKKRNEDAWTNMPATANAISAGMSTSDYFRKRAVNGTESLQE